MPCKFKKCPIPEIILVEPQVFGDERGFFAETYKYSEFVEVGITKPFVQSNHSKSQKGVLRGLHFQLNPKAQGKFIKVIAGEIFDVAVDIRQGSPTYGQWVGKTLSSENKHMLYIPSGFAHGFCVLSEKTEVLYSCTEEYAPQYERSIIWNDPDINIKWPIENPLVSEKDGNAPSLKEVENNFIYEK
ncbi:dTDP-4-dehydrorhamnose 3,5-epimerase [hydrothermal vent metagenome]|uniref:dTDP-4-dehydrorhamnose 3,5-epimerase n=1 Tax=hydrothermal vent metagenome TaxID=652676 RepID=A0A3B1E4B6_9ZZZZ